MFRSCWTKLLPPNGTASLRHEVIMGPDGDDVKTRPWHLSAPLFTVCSVNKALTGRLVLQLQRSEDVHLVARPGKYSVSVADWDTMQQQTHVVNVDSSHSVNLDFVLPWTRLHNWTSCAEQDSSWFYSWMPCWHQRELSCIVNSLRNGSRFFRPWSHVCVVVVVEDRPPTPWLADPPPTWWMVGALGLCAD